MILQVPSGCMCRYAAETVNPGPWISLGEGRRGAGRGSPWSEKLCVSGVCVCVCVCVCVPTCFVVEGVVVCFSCLMFLGPLLGRCFLGLVCSRCEIQIAKTIPESDKMVEEAP